MSSVFSLHPVESAGERSGETYQVNTANGRLDQPDHWQRIIPSGREWALPDRMIRPLLFVEGYRGNISLSGAVSELGLCYQTA